MVNLHIILSAIDLVVGLGIGVLVFEEFSTSVDAETPAAMAKKIGTALILQRCYDFINQFSMLYVSHMFNRHNTRI